MNWEQLMTLPAYDLNSQDKANVFTPALMALSQHHYTHSEDYRLIIDSLYKEVFEQGEVPALNVGLFKHHLLKSIPIENIFRITTSSGTTSQQVSQIVLDKENTLRQQKILATILKHWLGSKRLPMLIIDHPNVIKDKFSYSARGVGIQGMSLFGHDHTYALNEDMTINIGAVSQFFDKYKDQKVFIFGFTFVVWQYFIKQLALQQTSFQVNEAVLLHSGGWKKLLDQAVSNDAFKQQVQTTLGSVQVHNFYGMVEQTGTIYVECESGYLHCPVWSDVTILNKKTLKPEIHGIEGIIQVSSLLPTSYPGHRLLTEDLGVMLGEDDCTCGRHGKYFLVNGRLAKAEVRGCSDTQS
ncbi:LuxE/PaaK family acyltransferase [Psychromonas sp. L1A2]|uniref:LuxE/PaaK family acyltransferase n=1 Tax=Psychromonas sp. L1A2 TaxID=2686356 RepID=UPI0013572922|nr:acyl-protein synthetase [Psychromonas sp. L1A2]